MFASLNYYMDRIFISLMCYGKLLLTMSMYLNISLLLLFVVEYHGKYVGPTCPRYGDSKI